MPWANLGSYSNLRGMSFVQAWRTRRVFARLCASCDLERDELIQVLERPGGYRDLERGALSFREFYEFLRDRAGYRDDYMTLEELWANFFDGPMDGIAKLLDRVRREYLHALSRFLIH